MDSRHGYLHKDMALKTELQKSKPFYIFTVHFSVPWQPFFDDYSTKTR